MRNNRKNYKPTDDIAFFKRLAQFRREASVTSPDAFGEVARALFGMSNKEAQMLFAKYMHISNGAWSCWTEEQEPDTIDTLVKAQQVLDASMKLRPADCYRTIESYLGSDKWDDKNRIGVWARHKGGEPELHDLVINSPRHLNLIAEMEKSPDVDIICIVPYVDRIDDVRECMNDIENPKKRMYVYDGDIFVLFNRGTDNYWNRPECNGVYVCQNGAYRRLLYTVGRGYIARGKANVADDSGEENQDVFNYSEQRWNSYLITSDHKWKRIGNIHADITLLQENTEAKQ